MAQRTIGRIASYQLQPGRKVNIRSDGSATGTAVYVCDASRVLGLPKIGTPHPDDTSLVAHDIDIEFPGNGLAKATYSYFGVSTSYSDDNTTFDMESCCDQVSIQLHPNFESFAGTAESPADGALWIDPSTGKVSTDSEKAEFRGWISGEFIGVEYYLVSRPVVTKRYLRRAAPNLKTAMEVISKIPGFRNPPGIKNWLCLGGSISSVGGIFQITEQYKGSPDPGWNDRIYK